MKTQQYHCMNDVWKTVSTAPGFNAHLAQLVLLFGDADLVTRRDLFEQIRKTYPNGQIVSCSTAGEILGEMVYDSTIVATAIEFEKTQIACASTNIKDQPDSHEAGKYLMETLPGGDLTGILVISDGTFVNGSDLVAGINEYNPLQIPVSGGLAGDRDRFNKTFAGLNQVPVEGGIVAIGFYGRSLRMGIGSFGGWDEFGPEKIITRSEKNVLYEMDGENALEFYKECLGPYEIELPGSALLFPLALKEPGSEEHLVRTILHINEDERSMRFAGNLPQGGIVRLMKANFDKLITAASISATNAGIEQSNAGIGQSNTTPQLALLISCVGRKLVLQTRTEDEIAAARQVFGENVPIAGFYSYGEISPFNARTRCELQNQTMTITTFSES